MTEKEEAAILRTKIQEEKVQAYEYLNQLTRMDPTMLSHCGYKTLEEGLTKALKATAKRIEAMIKAHERKWSDKEEGA